MSYDFGEWDVVDEEYFKVLFKEVYRTMKNGATLVCFYDIWKLESLKNILESCGFRMFRFVIILKRIAFFFVLFFYFMYNENMK